MYTTLLCICAHIITRNPDWYGQYIFADYEARILARLQYDGEGKPWKAYKIADASQGKAQFAEAQFARLSYIIRLGCSACTLTLPLPLLLLLSRVNM
jgi:hypothetical protein